MDLDVGSCAGLASYIGSCCSTRTATKCARRDGAEFFFSGKGVTDSSRFQLIGYRGSVTARVDPGSQPMRTTGKVLTFTSIPVVLLSALFFGLAGSFVDDPDPTLREDWRATRRTSVITGALGLAMMGGGIALWATSGTSFSLERAAAATSGREARLGFAF